MLSKAIRDKLDQHRRPSMLWNPRRKLRYLKAMPRSEFRSHIGERPDGQLELVRQANGEAALELLLNEIDVAQRVEHDNLAKHLWIARTGREALTVGSEWLIEHKLSYPLDLRWLLRSFVAVCRAVAALHEAGVVHADLKPESICFAEEPGELLVWSLRMAQEPGPRRFDAYSARFAAPEQVSGGDLGFHSDVYALGVVLYSLFIRARFPSILVPKSKGVGSPSTTIPPGGFAEITARPKLSAATNLMALDFLDPGPGRPGAGGQGSGKGDTQAVLGAKIYFAHELERVMTRTANIGVAKELLAVIERATEQKAVDRYADADVFAGEIQRVLDLTEEIANGSN